MTPEEVETHAREYAETWTADPKTMGAGLMVCVMVFLGHVARSTQYPLDQTEKALTRLRALQAELDRRFPGEG